MWYHFKQEVSSNFPAKCRFSDGENLDNNVDAFAVLTQVR